MEVFNVTIEKKELINELIDFVVNSSDADNFIVSVFIAGLKAKDNPLSDSSSSNCYSQTCKPSKQLA